MMKKLFSLSISLLFSLALLAQAPDLINYQAVARDGAGVPLINTAVTVQFDIRQSNPTGTIVYSETHSSSTNPFGLFTLQIGGGTPVSGTFAGINWSTGLYYLQVTVNGDAMAPSQLLSVPYALHANTASSGTPGANGHNGLSAITTEPAGANCPNGGYLVDVGVDDNDDGTLQALEIDFSYYVCNGLDGAANTSDTSATNELQTLSISNDTVFLSNGGFVVLPPALGDNWGSQVVITSGPNLTGDGTIATPLMVIDNDSSATNELQNLSIAGNNINITNGTGAQLSATAPNTGDYLYWNGVNWVSQAPAANTDNQNLINGGRAGTIQTVDIQNGTGISFSVADGDSVATNEIQQLTFSNPTLSLNLGGGSVNLSGLNTDAQTLTYNNATQALGISNGNTVTLVVDDADADPTNEHNTGFAVNGGNLEITDGGGTLQVPLTNLSDGDWTTNATHLENANTGNVGIGPMLPSGPGYFLSTRKALTVAAINAYSAGDPAQVEIVGSSTNANDIGGRLAFGHITAGPTSVYDGGVEMNVGGEMMFQTGGATERMRITSAGAVGIGTANPLARFVVAGGNMILRDQSDVVDAVELASGTGAGASGSIGIRNSGINTVFLTGTGASWFNAGLLGVGTNAPTYSALDVNGQITQRTGAAAGYIPVSDANGTMTWTDPTTITTASFWDGSAGNIYPATITDQVGIGTSTPASMFEVQTTTNARAAQFLQSFASGLDKFGLYALAQGGGAGENRGVQGEATGATVNKGIVGRAFGGTNNYAGYFELGDVYIADNLGIGTTNAQFPLDLRTSADRGAYIETNGANSGSSKIGVTGIATGGTGAGDNKGGAFNAIGGTGGDNIGVEGIATGGSNTNIGIRAWASGATTNWAGYFGLGDVYIQNRLGIGTTTPLQPLHVNGNTQLDGVTQMNGTSGLAATLKVFGGLGAGVMYVFDGGGTKAFSVFSGGQVGIGAGPTGVTGILHIQDNDANTTGASGSHVNIQNLANTTNTTAGIRFRTGGSTAINGDSHYKGAIFFEDGATTNGEGDMIFAMNNVASSANVTTADAAMTIQSDGDIGIGTTVPNSQFHVNEVSGNPAMRVQVSGGTRFIVGSNGNVALYNSAAPAFQLTLNANSAAKPTSNVWTISSDRRLKTDIKPYQAGLSDILKIEPVWFTYNGKADMPIETGVGVIAQDLQKVAPYMIKEWDYTPTSEDTGEVTGPTETYLGVDNGAMTYMLINAIKEQQKLIEELKKEVEELKLKQQ